MGKEEPTAGHRQERVLDLVRANPMVESVDDRSVF
jgi:hypothetical protein